MKRLLIGSPIRQKPAILRLFLTSLERLQHGQHQFDFFFVDDNNHAESSQLLKDFCVKQQALGRRAVSIPSSENQDVYITNDTTHYWHQALILKVAKWKDEMIEEARRGQYDGLFLIDSDVLLEPQALLGVLQGGKPIVSIVFWTSWEPNTVEMPQVWLRDAYWPFQGSYGQSNPAEDAKASRQFLDQLRRPGIYEVGGLGACTFISNQALANPISFKLMPNVSLWGEDRHFCIRAAALGIGLFADTRYATFHVYRESQVEAGESFLQRYASITTDSEKGTAASQ